MRPRTPDGSQVHRAVGLDGRQLAVKVQHAGLRESGAVDVVTIGTAAKALAWAVPDYDYSWIAEETASNLPLVRALAFHPLAPSHPSPHPQASCALRRACAACAPPTSKQRTPKNCLWNRAGASCRRVEICISIVCIYRVQAAKPDTLLHRPMQGSVLS